MGRHVFFSFHYQRDVWRASQVRNSWVTQGNTTAGFWDDANWEAVKKKGEQAIKSWINEQMKGTSVTVVLIGAKTYNRKYVIYEIENSYKLNKGILGIQIHNIKDQNRQTDSQGVNPLDILGSHSYKTYDWVLDNGYHNIGRWIEEATIR